MKKRIKEVKIRFRFYLKTKGCPVISFAVLSSEGFKRFCQWRKEALVETAIVLSKGWIANLYCAMLLSLS